MTDCERLASTCSRAGAFGVVLRCCPRLRGGRGAAKPRLLRASWGAANAQQRGLPGCCTHKAVALYIYHTTLSSCSSDYKYKCEGVILEYE